MTGTSRRTAMLVVLLLAVAGQMIIVASACGGSTTKPGATNHGGATSTALRQSNDAANVTVEVTWKGQAAGPVFTVAMNTHSVDLDGYDLRTLAVLRTDRGTEAQATSWDAPKGGHHREGTLTFPAAAADGKPVLGSDTHALTLTIRGIAGVPERTFRWTL
jgi:hypothetical protein